MYSTDVWPALSIVVTVSGKTAYRKIHEFLVSCTFDKLYHTASSRLSLRQIACFTEELQRFVCDRATSPIIERLRSKGVAMHAYGVSVY